MEHSVRMPAHDTIATETRIAVISDTHLSMSGTAEAVERRRRFESAVEAVNTEAPHLVLMPGDLTENGLPEELAEFRRIAATLRPPTQYAAGNHDIGDKWIAGRPGITPARMDAYEAAMGPSRYACTAAGLRLVVLNASLMGSRLAEEDIQWLWLDAELGRPCAEPRVIMLHYPPYRQAPDEPAGDYWTIEMEPRLRLLRLAAQHRVKLILSGHLHAPIHALYEGVTLLSAPSAAFGLPFGVQPHGWMMITIGAEGRVTWEMHCSLSATSSQPE